MRLEEGIEFVQAAILLRDTILQPRYRTEERVWRAEDQSWRREDRQWRSEDMDWREEEQRNNQKQWRLNDLEQRSLDNARVIWGRFMEKNRRDVEERAEQLKSLGNLAALVAGFAVVAFLEFGDNEGFKKDKTLTLAFGTTAALVVGLNMNVMVASSLLHASILRSGKLYVDEAAEAEFMQQCLAFVTRFQVGMDPPAPRRTFEKHWHSRCESTWRWAFMLFVSGLVCFALNLVLATWIKFQDNPTKLVVTVVLAASLVFVARLLAFWAPHLFSTRPRSDEALRTHVLQLGEGIGMPFAWHRVPQQGDMSQGDAHSNFQDAGSRFVYVAHPSQVASETSSAMPPVATAFSYMSPEELHQDLQDTAGESPPPAAAQRGAVSPHSQGGGAVHIGRSSRSNALPALDPCAKPIHGYGARCSAPDAPGEHQVPHACIASDDGPVQTHAQSQAVHDSCSGAVNAEARERSWGAELQHTYMRGGPTQSHVEGRVRGTGGGGEPQASGDMYVGIHSSSRSPTYPSRRGAPSAVAEGCLHENELCRSAASCSCWEHVHPPHANDAGSARCFQECTGGRVHDRGRCCVAAPACTQARRAWGWENEQGSARRWSARQRVVTNIRCEGGTSGSSMGQHR